MQTNMDQAIKRVATHIQSLDITVEDVEHVVEASDQDDDTMPAGSSQDLQLPRWPFKDEMVPPPVGEPVLVPKPLEEPMLVPKPLDEPMPDLVMSEASDLSEGPEDSSDSDNTDDAGVYPHRRGKEKKKYKHTGDGPTHGPTQGTSARGAKLKQTKERVRIPQRAQRQSDVQSAASKEAEALMKREKRERQEKERQERRQMRAEKRKRVRARKLPVEAECPEVGAMRRQRQEDEEQRRLDREKKDGVETIGRCGRGKCARLSRIIPSDCEYFCVKCQNGCVIWYHKACYNMSVKRRTAGYGYNAPCPTPMCEAKMMSIQKYENKKLQREILQMKEERVEDENENEEEEHQEQEVQEKKDVPQVRVREAEEKKVEEKEEDFQNNQGGEQRKDDDKEQEQRDEKRRVEATLTLLALDTAPLRHKGENQARREERKKKKNSCNSRRLKRLRKLANKKRKNKTLTIQQLQKLWLEELPREPDASPKVLSPPLSVGLTKDCKLQEPPEKPCDLIPQVIGGHEYKCIFNDENEIFFKHRLWSQLERHRSDEEEQEDFLQDLQDSVSEDSQDLDLTDGRFLDNKHVGACSSVAQ